MSKYRLINPSIKGNMINSFSGKTYTDAAVDAWDTLSKYMTNNVPKFGFSIENTENGSLHHFMVQETLDEDDYAKYKISELDLKMKGADTKKFKERVKKFTESEMEGGKRHKHKHKKHDDDDSSSSSSSDYFSALHLPNLINYPQPIVYWWYDPVIYNLESVYIPTFVAPLTPYIEISTFNYYPY
jgi:hypothetical protein